MKCSYCQGNHYNFDCPMEDSRTDSKVGGGGVLITRLELHYEPCVTIPIEKFMKLVRQLNDLGLEGKKLRRVNVEPAELRTGGIHISYDWEKRADED